MNISSYGYQLSALSGLYGLSSIASQASTSLQVLGSLNASASQEQVQISGYGQLLSSISGFQSSLNGLEAPNAILQATATSSSAGVATATAASGAATASINLNVNQLAQAQTVQSAAFTTPYAPVASGTLSLQVGSKAAVSIGIGGTLNDAASAINAANTGVTASIVQDTAGAHLLLTGAETGAANTFTVSGASGLGLTQTQAAADAVFTVNGAAASSASNTGIALENGVTATLAKTGASTISVKPDFAGVQNAAQTLASAFNTLQSSVADVTAPGGQLANDALASSLASGLQTLAQGVFNNGTSSLTTLSQIGITVQGGSLNVNSNALQAAFNTDAAGTASLLSKAVQGFDALAQRFGGSGGAIGAVEQGLQQQQSIAQLLQPASASDLGALLSGFELLGAANPTGDQIQAIQQYAQSLSASNALGANASLVSGLFASFSTYA